MADAFVSIGEDGGHGGAAGDSDACGGGAAPVGQLPGSRCTAILNPVCDDHLDLVLGMRQK
ncbi:hypothetical protein D3C80_1844450 [compost metagenome]